MIQTFILESRNSSFFWTDPNSCICNEFVLKEFDIFPSCPRIKILVSDCQPENIIRWKKVTRVSPGRAYVDNDPKHEYVLLDEHKMVFELAKTDTLWVKIERMELENENA